MCIRTEQNWDAGQEFDVVVTPDGVLFRPKWSFPLSTLDEVLSFSKPGLRAKSEQEIDDDMKAAAKIHARDQLDILLAQRVGVD